ncbi:hypothetical protein D3C87_1442340 [compost metagenome]
MSQTGNCLQNRVGHQFLANIHRHHRQIGLGINRVTLDHQVLQRLSWIFRFKQRTVVSPADPVPQCIEIGIQPDRQTALFDLGAGRFIDEGATACGYDPRPLFQQPFNHPRFQRPELRLTIL